MGRHVIVLIVLLPLLGVLGFVGVSRLTGLELPSGGGDGETASAGGADAGGDAATDGGAAATATDGAVDGSPADATAPRPRETVRLIGMGWELLVPGILANGGTAPTTEGGFGEAGVDLHIRATRDIDRIEAALAQGGDDDDGAHIAILPLPAFVASYERLRALEPQVFAVVAWSRGREAILGPTADALHHLPRRNVILKKSRSASATLTSLFLLRHAGVGLDRLHLADQPVTANFTAEDRSSSNNSNPMHARTLATTADASQLVPYVAIAPAGYLGTHAETATAWTRAWFAGVTQMREDVPLAARTVAEIDGAPEPVALLRSVGQLDFVGLGQNARLLGLSGRGAVTIEALFQETWELWRGVGSLTSPAPTAAPLSTGPIIAIVLAGQSAPPAARAAQEPDFDTPEIIDRSWRADEGDLVDELGLLAGVFERSALEVGFRGSRAQAERVIAQACNRYDLPSARFRPIRGEGSGARVIVHAAP